MNRSKLISVFSVTKLLRPVKIDTPTVHYKKIGKIHCFSNTNCVKSTNKLQGLSRYSHVCNCKILKRMYIFCIQVFEIYQKVIRNQNKKVNSNNLGEHNQLCLFNYIAHFDTKLRFQSTLMFFLQVKCDLKHALSVI